MAKKKKQSGKKPPASEKFSSNPFSNLKGFAVSAPEEPQVEKAQPVPQPAAAESPRSFAEEMAQLGVERLAGAEEAEAEQELPPQESVSADAEGEAELFLQAMGELQVEFRDQLPQPQEAPRASAQRMKQLKQGRLQPQATLDLHGLKQAEVAEKLQFFLQNAQRQGLQTLLVVTGRGLHSVDGEPLLRNQAERFLVAEGRKWLVEWGRAPRQYGGDGALVLFMRRPRKRN